MLFFVSFLKKIEASLGKSIMLKSEKSLSAEWWFIGNSSGNSCCLACSSPALKVNGA
jgi:hypothetical protein